jgi:hypothetical protein
MEIVTVLTAVALFLKWGYFFVPCCKPNAVLVSSQAAPVILVHAHWTLDFIIHSESRSFSTHEVYLNII